MNKRFGGVLAIALGTVLILNGVSQTGEGSVGVLDGQCGAVQVGALPSQLCPTGAIRITDVTPAGPDVPADWDVTITSTNCLATKGAAVNVTITVPTGGSATASDLYVYTNNNAAEDGTKCAYTLVREVNPAFTATFTPASPVTLPFVNADPPRDNGTMQVTLLNEAVVDPTTSAAPSTSTAPSTSASASVSASESSSSASAAPASDTAAAAPIAETGPGQPVKASLWVGIALVLLGLFLCFEGRVRRFARHRT